jgi:hypothetical protein
MKRANPVNVSNLILQSPAGSLREAKPMPHNELPRSKAARYQNEFLSY